jgi:hypothetical protein
MTLIPSALWRRVPLLATGARDPLTRRGTHAEVLDAYRRLLASSAIRAGRRPLGPRLCPGPGGRGSARGRTGSLPAGEDADA